MSQLPTKGGMRGELLVTAIDRKGNRFAYLTPNLLTFSASKAAAHFLMGETAYMAATLRVGTGGTAPARTDTALGGEIHSETITTVAFPTDGVDEIGQVTFSVFIDYNEPETDGQVLQEAGLFSTNGLLIARQVHGPVTKDSNFKLEYRWRIVFT